MPSLVSTWTAVLLTQAVVISDSFVFAVMKPSGVAAHTEALHSTAAKTVAFENLVFIVTFLEREKFVTRGAKATSMPQGREVEQPLRATSK